MQLINHYLILRCLILIITECCNDPSGNVINAIQAIAIFNPNRSLEIWHVYFSNDRH
ncbi:hypothetical protein SAMN05216518_1322 [Bacteroidales bacterium KHT7]|nr:hypothetical protein SAMN05216518_1322 [Bacteroidales bacterium KHT7]